MTFLRHFILLITALSGIIPATAQPQILWRNTLHDFGAFNEDTGTAKASFRYVNTGTDPLIIINARTTCGCTIADYSRKPLAPGDSAEIAVEYNPAGRPGRFEKGIIVDTNTEPRRSKLTIKGTVVGGEASVRALYPVRHGPLALRKAAALAGDVVKGHMKTVFINAYNCSNDTLAPEIGTMPDFIHISVEPSRIPPGEQASFIVYFHSDRCPEWGLSETEITITPGKGSEAFRLPVVANIVKNFSSLTDKERMNAPVIAFDPEKVEIKNLRRNSPQATASIRIANRGHSVLELRRIYSPDRGIGVRLPQKMKIKPGKDTAITITVNPGELPGDVLNARITVISNDPAAPVSNIRVVGEITN